MKEEKEKFSLKKRAASFRFAFQGIKTLLQSEHNAWIHLTATILVFCFGFYFKISSQEWMTVCFAIGFVFSMEIINTAFEKLCDFVSPEKHELIKQIKDLSAAAVLIAAITAFVIGCIIFIPKIV
ncbi:diacylglycerol kinase family protein [Arachidicoccus soli]|uniref:Diacylglycerol kinase family protein n=1 Tax=Arachidicoccus soli TaxID=2341117 RepID=A0A386HMS7_9BACT|nr:diacylglycerol kinase family protein [Arachidicoccus soli]AYD46644.1 diacylglycerol kinase family protein [Arachidicoccus soli]